MSKKKNKQDIFFEASNAWLGLGDVSNLKYEDPLKNIFDPDPMVLATNYIEVLRRPEYLHYFVKKVLNIDLLPIQAAILREFWIRPFPMYLASRRLW